MNLTVYRRAEIEEKAEETALKGMQDIANNDFNSQNKALYVEHLKELDILEENKSRNLGSQEDN